LRACPGSNFERENKMKSLRILPLLLMLAAAGCKDAASMLPAAHATPTEGVRYEYVSEYSGANIPASAARGQVYEYH
jgi:hypothetical protein